MQHLCPGVHEGGVAGRCPSNVETTTRGGQEKKGERSWLAGG